MTKKLPFTDADIPEPGDTGWGQMLNTALEGIDTQLKEAKSERGRLEARIDDLQEELQLNLAWSQLPGPPGGPVTDISYSKADPDWIYAGSRTAGIHVSSDGGLSWVQGISGMHHSPFAWVSPHDPKIAYGAAEMTRNGGNSWVDHNEDSPYTQYLYPKELVHRIKKLAWDPFDKQTIYAATGIGFYRTVDDGESWQNITVEPNEGVNDYRRFAVHPKNEGELILGTRSSGIVKSTDHGETWSLVPGSENIPDQLTRGLVYGDPSSREIYVAKNGFGVYRLLNGQVTEITRERPPLRFEWWTYFSLSADRRHLYFIACSKATDSCWENRKLFSYDRITEDLSTVTTPEKPSGVTTHPHDPSRIFLGGTAWPYESQDGGKTWQKRPNGFNDNYLATVAVNQTRPDTVYPGSICSTGLSVSRDRGNTYEWKRSGLNPWHQGKFGEHYVMQISARDDYAYATTGAGLLISTDGGDTWELLDNRFSGQGNLKGEAFAHLHGLAIHPNDPQVVYVGTGIGDPTTNSNDIFEGAKIWKSEDGGESWDQITDGFPTASETVIHDIVVNPHNPGEVYIGTLKTGQNHNNPGSAVGKGIYKSNDGGENWRQLDTPFSNIHSITIDATKSKTIYASIPKWGGPQHEGVYRTMDGGKNWEKILSHNTKGLIAHPDISGLLFSGSQKYPNYWDVLVTENAGETWAEGNFTIQLGTELAKREYDAVERYPNLWGRGQIMAFAIDEANSLLYSATNGAGLWRADVSMFE